ncbi:hypothetical protein D9613_001256 [Agrocybe pediades]|uniref:C2H2-type domain-containing protein n=1 Tax=Agrocybe pediades TaxID=84607 RepID=A0A8H4R098_9AGAR|nr:hypothetical protein D9613_001256 [Agrocybe pediades]
MANNLTDTGPILGGSSSYQYQCCGYAKCQETFLTMEDLVEHVKSHSGEAFFVSCYCGARFNQVGLVNHHLYLMHPTTPNRNTKLMKKLMIVEQAIDMSGVQAYGETLEDHEAPAPAFPTAERQGDSPVPCQKGALKSFLPDSPSVVVRWVAPVKAFGHISGIQDDVDRVLRCYGISSTSSALYAGFDASLIDNGAGYLQQIHLFTTTDTRIPVFKDDGAEWHFDEFVRNYFESGLGRVDAALISEERGRWANENALSMEPEDAGAPGRHQGKRSRAGNKNRKGNGKGKGKTGGDREGNGQGRRHGGGDEDEHDAGSGDEEDNDSEGSDPDDDPKKPVTNSSSGPHEISFNVQTTIRCNNDGPLGMEDEQAINSSGSMSIQLMDETADSRKYEIDFTRIAYSSARLGLRNPFFEQSHLQISIDSRRDDGVLKYTRPQQTTGSSEHKKTSSSKTTTNVNASVNLSASPSGTIGISKAWEKGEGQEYMQAVSRINVGERLGFLWWGYEVNDEATRTAGLKMLEGNLKLPSLTLKYRLPPQVPATAEGGNEEDPSDKRKSSRDAPIDVEFASFWTLAPKIASSSASSTSSSSSSSKFMEIIRSANRKRPSYSNMIQCIILTIPPVLKGDSAYIARINVDNIAPDVGVQAGNGGSDTQVAQPGPVVSETTERVVQHDGDVKFATGTISAPDERMMNDYTENKMRHRTMLTLEAPKATKVEAPVANSSPDAESSAIAGRKKGIRAMLGNLGKKLFPSEKKDTILPPEKDVSPESGEDLKA